MASSGLLEFMNSAQCPRPTIRIGDEMNEMAAACQSECDLSLICQWALESLERNYSSPHNSMRHHEILLLCRKFNNSFAQMRLPEISVQTANQHQAPPIVLCESNGSHPMTSSAVSELVDSSGSDGSATIHMSAPTVSPIAHHSAYTHPRTRDNSFLDQKISEIEPYVDGFEHFKAKFRERFPGISKISEMKGSIRMNSTC